MQQRYTKFDCIFTYKRVYSLPIGISFVLPYNQKSQKKFLLGYTKLMPAEALIPARINRVTGDNRPGDDQQFP